MNWKQFYTLGNIISEYITETFNEEKILQYHIELYIIVYYTTLNYV